MQEILNRAAEIDGRQTSLDEDMLEKTAVELGISVEAVRQARKEHAESYADRTLRQEFIAERREAFRDHLIPYVSVNAFLHVINFLTSRDSYWAIYPLLGWGIGLAIHYFTMMPTSGPAFEREFQSYKKRKLAKKILRQEASRQELEQYSRLSQMADSD